MLKIFVTGDNHLGRKYSSHEQAAVLAASRTNAFDGMVAAANSEDCGLFVITGDLFDNTGNIPKKDIRALLEKLAKFGGTVAILPGNHDYYDRDVKLWQSFKEISAEFDNILLMCDFRPYSVEINGESVVLYPALCTSLHSAAGENNLGWIKNIEPESSDYNIGVAHGAVEGETIDSEGQYFLMTRDELENIPVDCWLIGHTHVPFPRGLTEEFTPCEKILNAGTHVQTDVSCNTEGLCFIVEIDSEKNIRAKKFVSGNLRFYRKNIVLTAGEMKNILSRELDGISAGSVVDLVLSGAVTAEEYEQRNEIIEEALARFTEGTYNDSTLSRLISKELIDSEFPETSLSAGFLNALLSDPKEAQLAYELLQSLKEGK